MSVTPLRVVRNPTGKGGFQKGKSGNPAGRRKGSRGNLVDLKKLAQQYTAEAFAAVVDIMRDKETAPTVVLGCATVIFERGYGRVSPAEPETPMMGFDIDKLTYEELDALGGRVLAAIESVKVSGGDRSAEGDQAGGAATAA
jgi:hypothetical protein